MKSQTLTLVSQIVVLHSLLIFGKILACTSLFQTAQLSIFENFPTCTFIPYCMFIWFWSNCTLKHYRLAKLFKDLCFFITFFKSSSFAHYRCNTYFVEEIMSLMVWSFLSIRIVTNTLNLIMKVIGWYWNSRPIYSSLHN